ncbi:MAG: sodium-translocating pyrophosphatase [Fervidicoccaceae archaeon]
MKGLIPVAVIGLIGGALGFIFAIAIYYLLSREEMGTERMVEIWKAIREGSSAYMKRQTKTILSFSALVSILVMGAVYFGYKTRVLTVYPQLGDEVIKESILVGASVFLGSISSLIAAFFSMDASTKANVRTAAAAIKSAQRALRNSVLGGAVLGLSVPSLSLLFISALYLIYSIFFNASIGNPLTYRFILDSLAGFAFGASLSALFAQLGGGIYTKAADIGADLVGKVEASIPEDDPRNPAVIADQVGDNVGDCAGRGADIFESVTAETIGAMMIGWVTYFILSSSGLSANYASRFMFLPLLVSLVGIVSSLPGILTIILQKKFNEPMEPMRNGVIVSSIISLILLFLLYRYEMPEIWLNLYIASIFGIVAGIVMVLVTNYYTGLRSKSVIEIAESSQSGPALTFLSGLSVGMRATLIPVVTISIAILASFISLYFSPLPSTLESVVGGLNLSRFIYGIYGTAIATMGMLTLTGIIMTLDGSGPIADNAGGIAEMSGLSKEVRERLDPLDALGNVTKALTKGYAMGSAALASLLLFQAFVQDYVARDPSVLAISSSAFVINISGFAEALKNFFGGLVVTKPVILISILIGAMLPYYFTSMGLKAVTKAAYMMVEEVRRQFKEKPGILEGREKPDYYRAVDISTQHAIRNMIAPSLSIIITPLILGTLFGGQAVGALVVGATASSIVLGVMMMWGGAAWDNAKKYVEAGNLGGKGSQVHAATVIGDTVGDPLKDTVGPSLHILIKLLNTISLVFIPLYMLYLLQAFFP